MEEVVRAFNFVIEKGWVRQLRHINWVLHSRTHVIQGSLLGDIRVVSSGDRGSPPYVCAVFLIELVLIVSTDVATRLNLIGPIAEQCEHKYVRARLICASSV